MAITLTFALGFAALAPNAELEREARTTVRRYCTPCHDGADADAKPAALAVFDVVSARWAANMSAVQLTSATRRVEGKASARTAASFRAFVREELATRS
jgi:hypothetical protein